MTTARTCKRPARVTCREAGKLLTFRRHRRSGFAPRRVKRINERNPVRGGVNKKMTIHEAINKVMDEVGYVKKSKAANLNYSFAGEAALIAALRPAMVENGIYMSVSKVHNITRENYTTAKGTAMVNTVIHATVKFTHTSGESIDVDAVGEGSDSGDKSANKAMTGLYKYALRQTFCIETGDDPDKYASEERAAEKPHVINRTALIARYTDRLARAAALGINVKEWELTDKMTDDEIIKLGVSLNVEIEKTNAKKQGKAEQFNEGYVGQEHQ